MRLYTLAKKSDDANEEKCEQRLFLFHFNWIKIMLWTHVAIKYSLIFRYRNKCKRLFLVDKSDIMWKLKLGKLMILRNYDSIKVVALIWLFEICIEKSRGF